MRTCLCSAPAWASILSTPLRSSCASRVCFKIKIPDQNVAILRSINTVVDYVLEQQGQKGGAA